MTDPIPSLRPMAVVDGADLEMLLQYMRNVVEYAEDHRIRCMRFRVDAAGVHIMTNDRWSRPYGLSPRID